MPPHGHHGHGGHHGGGHHGHGGGYAAPAWYGGWGWQDPATTVVVTDDSQARILAYIASLPASQRAAAYQRFFGHPAPPPMSGLGDLSIAGIALPVVPLLIGTAIGWLAHSFVIRKVLRKHGFAQKKGK